jgi:hypothetical protein
MGKKGFWKKLLNHEVTQELLLNVKRANKETNTVERLTGVLSDFWNALRGAPAPTPETIEQEAEEYGDVDGPDDGQEG